MNPSQPKPASPRSLLWWFMRGFWTLLVAVHLWPLVSLTVEFFSAPSVSTGFGLAVVFAVTALFLLKAVDAVALQFRRPGLEFVAFFVVTGLIHGDMVAGRKTPALAVESATAVIVASSGAMACSRRVRQRVRNLLRGLAGRLTLTHDRRPIGMIRMAAGLSADQVWRCCTPARAPPEFVA